MFCYWVLKATLLPPIAPRSPKLQRSGVWFCRDKKIKRSWAPLGEAMAALLKMVWLRKKKSEARRSHVEACLWYWRVFKSMIQTLRNSISLSHLPLLPPNLILSQNTWKKSHWANWHETLGMQWAECTVVWNQHGHSNGAVGWDGNSMSQKCAKYLCVRPCVRDSYIPCLFTP